MPRPAKSADELSVAVSVSAETLALIDVHVARVFDPPRTHYERSKFRRRVIDSLVFANLTHEARHPLFIEVVAPIGKIIDEYDRDVAEQWVAAEKLRINQEAPKALRAVLEDNRKERQARRKES